MIAASAEWFAETKSAPKSEVRRHMSICEGMRRALAGESPAKQHYREEYDANRVMDRLAIVSDALRSKVGE